MRPSAHSQTRVQQFAYGKKEVEMALSLLEQLKQVLRVLSVRMGETQTGASDKIHKTDCIDAGRQFNLMGEKIHKLHGVLNGMHARFERSRLTLEIALENCEAAQSCLPFPRLLENES